MTFCFTIDIKWQVSYNKIFNSSHENLYGMGTSHARPVVLHYPPSLRELNSLKWGWDFIEIPLRPELDEWQKDHFRRWNVFVHYTEFVPNNGGAQWNSIQYSLRHFSNSLLQWVQFSRGWTNFCCYNSRHSYLLREDSLTWQATETYGQDISGSAVVEPVQEGELLWRREVYFY